MSGNKKGDDLVEQESWDGKTKNMNESSCRFYVRVEKYQLHLLKMKNYKEQEVNEEYRRMPVTLQPNWLMTRLSHGALALQTLSRNIETIIFWTLLSVLT